MKNLKKLSWTERGRIRGGATSTGGSGSSGGSKTTMLRPDPVSGDQ